MCIYYRYHTFFRNFYKGNKKSTRLIKNQLFIALAQMIYCSTFADPKKWGNKYLN